MTTGSQECIRTIVEVDCDGYRFLNGTEVNQKDKASSSTTQQCWIRVQRDEKTRNRVTREFEFLILVSEFVFYFLSV